MYEEESSTRFAPGGLGDLSPGDFGPVSRMRPTPSLHAHNVWHDIDRVALGEALAASGERLEMGRAVLGVRAHNSGDDHDHSSAPRWT